MFLDFSLANVLRACNFSSLICPDGLAPAALASLLFEPPEPQIIGKTPCFATCYLFAHLHLLSYHSFSSLIFSLLPFSSLTLPTSAFPSVHIVGSLTSKLPSAITRIWDALPSLFFFTSAHPKIRTQKAASHRTKTFSKIVGSIPVPKRPTNFFVLFHIYWQL